MKNLKARRDIAFLIFLRNRAHGEISGPSLPENIRIRVPPYHGWWKGTFGPERTRTVTCLNAPSNRIENHCSQIDVVNSGGGSEFQQYVSGAVGDRI